MVTTVGRQAPRDTWDAPWAPTDPAAYMEGVGVVVNHIHVGSPPARQRVADTFDGTTTRASARAASQAIADATGSEVEVPDRPERSERVESSGDDAIDAFDDDIRAYDSPRLRVETDPYRYTPERNPFGEGTDEAAKAAVHRMRTEAKPDERRVMSRASKDRRNARDRDRRLKAAINKLAAGGRLSGPTPRGR